MVLPFSGTGWGLTCSEGLSGDLRHSPGHQLPNLQGGTAERTLRVLGGRPPAPASVSEKTCLLIYIQNDQSQRNQRVPTTAGHASLFSGSL